MTTSDTPSKKASRIPPRRPPEVDGHVDAFLSTVCDTSRRYILEILTTPGDEESYGMPEWRSGDIARTIGLSPATTSEHLRILADKGLVTSRREGNTVYYRLRNHELIGAFNALVEALASDYTPR